MTTVDYKKFIKRIAERISPKSIVRYGVFALIMIFLAVLVLDAVIFWRYYQIAVQPSSPGVLRLAEISIPDFEKALEIIKKREAGILP